MIRISIALGIAGLVLASMPSMGVGRARANANPSAAAVGAEEGNNLLGTMRICADPSNLPFSSAEGSKRGVYVEIADLVAGHLQLRPQYFWWLSYAQGKALRNTVLADNCDAYFALSSDAGTTQLALSRPFLTVGYVIVGPRSVDIENVAGLRNKRIAVQFGTPPQILLAQADGFSPVTVRSCGEGLDSLSRGDVDVAFLWGPEAGYLNAQRYNSRWRITPVRAAGLQTDLVVALRSGETELLQHVNGALDELEPQIREISRKYAFPDGDPIETALDNVGPDTATAAVRAEDPGPAVSPAGDAVEGKAFFNNTCSHCHAPNGQSPLQERDLRRLTNRYGDNWMDVAKTTIREGRQELGMPTWKDVLSEQDLQNVLSFLATIQNH